MIFGFFFWRIGFWAFRHMYDVLNKLSWLAYPNITTTVISVCHDFKDTSTRAK